VVVTPAISCLSFHSQQHLQVDEPHPGAPETAGQGRAGPADVTGLAFASDANGVRQMYAVSDNGGFFTIDGIPAGTRGPLGDDAQKRQ